MKRKFIYQDEKSHKFWDIEVNLSGLTVNFGKYGTAGQQQSKVFTSVEECFKAAEKLIAEKTKKGYVEVKEALPPREMYNDMIAVARMLEATFPDKVEINQVTEENIQQMEAASGLEMDEDFKTYWLEKGSMYFDKDDFVFALYAYDQSGQIANNLYGVLGLFCTIHRARFDVLDNEMAFLIQGTLVLGMIISGKEKWILVQNRVGIYQIYFEEEFQEYSEQAFAEKLAPVLQAKDTFDYPALEPVQQVEEEEEEDDDDEEDEDDGEPSQEMIDLGIRRVTYDEVLALLGVEQLWNYWEEDDDYQGYESESEYYEEVGGNIYYCDRDLTIAGDLEWLGIRELLVVKGNLDIKGMLRDSYGDSQQYYVTGNTTMDYIDLGYFQYTGGTETIRYVASAWHQDDEIVAEMPFRKINAPYFFSWFYNLNCFEFAPNTVITALYNEDELNAYKTKNVFLPWHAYAYVFRDELCYVVEEQYHDTLSISPRSVYKALKEGQPVFREGVTTEGILLTAKGKQMSERPEAYQVFKQAIAKAPGYYMPYYEAGECLFNAKAYQQGKEYYLKAIPLAPEKVKYDLGAISYAALCDIRLGDYEGAIALAKTAVARDEKAAFAMRVWAEALILQGKLDEAKPLLVKSVDIRSIFSNNWLLGLVYHLQGNKKKALEQFDTASYYSSRALPYEQHTNLDYIFGENVTVDWENYVAPVKKEKGQEEWDQYFAKNQKTSYSALITAIPEPFRTREMLTTFLQKDDTPGDVIKYFDPAVYTEELILSAVQRTSPAYYTDIPDQFLTAAVLENHPYGMYLEKYPKELLNYDVYFKAVWKNQRAYDEVPAEFKDERMNIALIAGGAVGKYPHVHLPKKYKGVAYLKQAIDIDIKAITNFSANLVDREVFEYAAEKYGQDPGWPFIVDAHSREHWKYGGESDIMEMSRKILKYGIDVFDQVEARRMNKHYFDFYKKHLGHHPEFSSRAEAAGWIARSETTNEYIVKDEFDSSTFEKVWACFWDEDFIIRALTAHDTNRSERIIDVPAKYLTKKICDVAVDRNSYDFQFVPRHLMTAELCELAVSRDYGSAIEYVPLSMRTKKVCELALARDVDNIRFIPGALREPQLFLSVLNRNNSFTKYIPKQQYAAVFEFLGTKFANRFDKDFVALHWGLGLILDGQYTAARAQLAKVKEGVALHQAKYYTGWSYFLEGDATKATEYFKAAQEVAVDKEDLLDFPYASFQLPDVPDVYEMSQEEFDGQMREASLLVQSKNYEEAAVVLERAEKMLADANCSEMRLWAYVWDYQRYAWYEAGREDDSLALCARTVAQLGKVLLWDYLEDHNPIRHALRSAHNNLAYRCYQTATDLKGVLEGINHIKITMKTVSPIEDKHVLDVFLETQALLYHKAAGFDSKYQKDFDRVKTKIGKMKDKSIFTEEILSLMS